MTEEWQHDLRPPVGIPDEPSRHSYASMFRVVSRAFGKMHEAIVRPPPRANSYFFGIEVSTPSVHIEPQKPTHKVYPTSFDSWYREYDYNPPTKTAPPIMFKKRNFRR